MISVIFVCWTIQNNAITIDEKNSIKWKVFSKTRRLHLLTGPARISEINIFYYHYRFHGYNRQNTRFEFIFILPRSKYNVFFLSTLTERFLKTLCFLKRIVQTISRISTFGLAFYPLSMFFTTREDIVCTNIRTVRISIIPDRGLVTTGGTPHNYTPTSVHFRHGRVQTQITVDFCSFFFFFLSMILTDKHTCKLTARYEPAPVPNIFD